MDNYFHTKSLNLVAWLIANEIPIYKTVVLGNNTIFYFEHNEKVESLIQSYNSNEVLKKFISAFKYVKDVVRKNKNK